MAGENQIVLEIVLDDGSVQKGFARIKEQGQEASKELDGSFKSFANTFRNAFKIDGLADLNAGFQIIQKSIASIGAALQGAFNLSVQAEQIRVVNAQFELLAKNAGLSAEQLSQGLQQAARGLVDTEDLLQAANGAIVQLGSNAQRLPEIFELSRRVSAIFGGDLIERFQEINQAIATGQSRLLKSIGLQTDFEAATKKAAAALGISKDQLTDAQIQQVRLNAVLETASKNLGAVETENSKLQQSSARLSVSLKELGDAGAILFDRVFGDAIRGSVDRLSLSFSRLAVSLKEISGVGAEPAEKLAALQGQLKALSEQKALEVAATGGAQFNSVLDDQIRIISRDIAAQEALIAELNKNAAANRGAAVAGSANNEIQATAEQRAIALAAAEERRNQVLKESLSLRSQALSTREAGLANIEDPIAQAAQREQLLTDRLALLETERQIKLKEIRDTFALEKGFTEAQRQELEIAANEAFNLRQQELERQRQATALANLRTFAGQASAVARSLGITFQKSFGTAIAGGFAAFGRALAEGENAFKAFGKAFIGILGGILVQLGTGYILQGIAISANPLTPGAGAALIGAGAALAVFGGFLQAIGGGGGAGGGGVATADSGSGIGSPATTLAGEQDIDRTAAPTGVQVVVNGSIFDTTETGSRIVGLINEAFDQQGVVVRQGVAG